MSLLQPTAPLRAGLIGFGFAGQTFHAPLLLSTPGIALAAVASSDAAKVHAALGTESGAELAVHADPAALIARDDIELVVVATPNDTHHPLALQALQAGKAVVVDKPFALHAGQAAELVRLADARGLLLSVFHNRRWDGDFLTAQQLVRDGRLGRITHAELHFDRYRPQIRQRWRESAEAGGGLWIDLAPHLIDQAVQLFGEPAAIQADIAVARDHAQADDWFHAQLRYAGGLRVTLHASALTAQPGARFTLHGTHGSYRKWGLDAQEDALKAGQRPDPARPAAWGHDPQIGSLALATRADDPNHLATSELPTLPGNYPAYYAGIRDALRRGAPNPVPPGQALGVMRLIDLGRRSAQERRELPFTPE
ncbi:MAG TPA: oxidoreductase [Ideonella sp.]|nr:oxidoreductase [Ideonella sp.]